MSVQDELIALATEVEEGDPNGAAKLRSLAIALYPANDPGGWIGVDPKDVIDLEAMVAAVVTGDGPTGRAAKAEVARNVLILVPIILTWLGLFYAALAYQQVIASNPELAGEPFLLLWEQGFYGLVEPPLAYLGFLRLSTVALVDFGVLVVVFVLTGYIQREVSMSQHARDVRSRDLSLRLTHALGDAYLMLAERFSPARVFGQFEVASKALVAELIAERDHVVSLADERKLILQDFRLAAREFRAGSSALAKAGADYTAVAAQLTATVAAMRTDMAAVKHADDDLAAAINGMAGELRHDHEVGRANEQQLGDLAAAMLQAMEQVLPAVAKLGSATGEVKSAADKVLEAMREDARTRHDNSSDMRAASAAIIAAGVAVAETRTAGEKAAADLAAAVNALRSASKVTSDSATAVSGAAVQAADAIARAASDHAQMSDKLTTALRDNASTTQSNLDALSNTTGEMRRAVGDQAAASESAAQVIREAARQVEDAATTMSIAVTQLESFVAQAGAGGGSHR